MAVGKCPMVANKQRNLNSRWTGKQVHHVVVGRPAEGLGANIASRRRTQCAAATAADCDDFAAPVTTLTLGFQDCHHALD